MKFSILTTLASVLIASITTTSVSAIPVAPVNIVSRDVYVPPITYPTAGVVWTSGETQTVTWDNTNPPVNITNPVGRIFLRKGGSTLPLFLANDFDIRLGSIQVVVPLVVEASDYSLVLFGDSGNWSPEFTITGSGVKW